jgi:hypothetical protein
VHTELSSLDRVPSLHFLIGFSDSDVEAVQLAMMRFTGEEHAFHRINGDGAAAKRVK